jgi:para-aminobenzoate synthetase component 1
MDKIPVIYLNSNDGTGILAFGEDDRMSYSEGQVLPAMDAFLQKHKGAWLFMTLSYELKNEICGLTSANRDEMQFPTAMLWRPRYVVRINRENVVFLQGIVDEFSEAFVSNFMEEEMDTNFHHPHIEFIPEIDKQTYISKVNALKAHLQRGDIYEVNFCQEFYCRNAVIEFPTDAYFKLNTLTRTPFSAYLRMDEFTVMCYSPERYMRKTGAKLISQPIKGTAPRDADAVKDAALAEWLKNDPKERSENVMIVDLVRNDMSRVAEKGTVRVEELCGIHSFETVHQMISTVACEVREDVSFTDILRATFPMGSMTGAPKYRAMQLIEEHESFQRGLFSGSIGYIDPNGDFDLNVVIRTVIHNAKNGYLSCGVGSAITIQSDPEKEYEECLVKVKKIMDGVNA